MDVTPLADLQKIYCLDLLDCKISNIAALTNLTGAMRPTSVCVSLQRPGHRPQEGSACPPQGMCRATQRAASRAGLRRLGLRKSRILDVTALTRLSTVTALDIRRTNFADTDELGLLPELRLLVLPEKGAQGARAVSPPAHTRQPLTVLRDDGGYLGCSFKHANLKHHDRQARAAGRRRHERAPARRH